VAKRQAAIRAGKKLRDAAVRGDTKTLARMVLKGEPVYIDERDWYLRDVRRQEAADGDTPETNAFLSTTGAWAVGGGRPAKRSLPDNTSSPSLP